MRQDGRIDSRVGQPDPVLSRRRPTSASWPRAIAYLVAFQVRSYADRAFLKFTDAINVTTGSSGGRSLG